MKPRIHSPALCSFLLGSAISLTAPAAFALPYTWTQNSVATQDWTTPGNWLSSSQFVSGTTNELKFFGDITTALANGINAITTNVPATLSMNILTLNGLGTSTTLGSSTINIASSSSTWTLDGTTPTVNLNGLNNTTKLLNYNIAANLTLVQATTAFTGNGTAGFNFSGVISGSSKAITKSGTSILTLSGANTYSGATTVSGGTLSLNHADAIKNSASVSVASGATLRINLATTYTNSNTVTIAGTGVGLNNGALRFQNSSVWAAPIDLTATSTLYSFGAAVSTTLNGAITGTGNLTFASRGGVGTTHTAVWTLNAAGGHSGTTSIVNDAGLKDITVKLGLTNALPTGTSLNLSTINNTASGAAAFATLDLNGRDQELAGLTDTGGIVVTTGAGNTSNKRVINSSATLATLKINNAGNITYGTTGTEITAGTIGGTTAAGVAANNLALTKTGAGTFTLSGANTYTGDTSITGGKLTISSTGTINGTSGVTIGTTSTSAVTEFNYNSATALSQSVSFAAGSTGGTLSGTGTITPAVTITSGNRQTAGSSVTATNNTASLGKQTFSTGITFDSGSIFEWNLTGNTTRGTDFDAVNTASLGATSGAIFRVILNGTQNFGETFWDSDRTWAGIFKNIAESSAYDLSTVFNGGFEYQNSGGVVSGVTGTQGAFTFINGGTDLKWTAVPEPTSALAGLLLTAGLLRRRRVTHVSADGPCQFNV